MTLELYGFIGGIFAYFYLGIWWRYEYVKLEPFKGIDVKILPLWIKIFISLLIVAISIILYPLLSIELLIKYKRGEYNL